MRPETHEALVNGAASLIVHLGIESGITRLGNPDKLEAVSVICNPDACPRSMQGEGPVGKRGASLDSYIAQIETEGWGTRYDGGLGNVDEILLNRAVSVR